MGIADSPEFKKMAQRVIDERNAQHKNRLLRAAFYECTGLISSSHGSEFDAFKAGIKYALRTTHDQ
jgi:uncharacterized protein (DUF1810 family)